MTQNSTPLTADATGTLWKIIAQSGEVVSAGAELFVLESMKMEIPFEAQMAGHIDVYHAAEGDVVEEGQTVATFIVA
ncbi:acetyl-CoA carboxylase biotin carboxyl carrier protein subunit [Paraburkholderia silvatlantica]|uniref:Acetyl-CoA carboxylase biotin carboxyl carrier protein n=1 Tax=Paraburkholderia silvatlantica TaxID=321895 RepID=A0A2U1A9M0_9BURK|nr:acetyl-CoA carboxylase biotin carboxyl carrier protein subunit [Paraburkholderia silvatlantica]MBB2930543.1 acetyl-CoA carboxylase biotin carboxyl carrier protein [Paraburkholderia silvatlantica]PVY30347.1 acetyl-CoA carboxylase biotin carboxyl carrier protein [Paraburkholderia silvatlantica]PXW36916.1 acetyl-CoA carboxylase biotin carboxyl carrier protein [Paraburkholderia silvatlantica]PYE21256.1 acetyl-CoA carboxylase biotin carboxyl carrier protein [Paraburkholderia silvatlantica]TDQ866